MNDHTIQSVLVIAIALSLATARGAVTIDPGATEIYIGTASSVEIPIAVFGGDAVTDLTGAISIAGGAMISSVSYAGSIWESAPGGYIDFFPGFSPPSATIDPNISLQSAGETVSASGTLVTITVDITGLPIGEYPIALSITAAGSTGIFTSGGTELVANLLPGTLRILQKPIVLWRESEFPADVGNPAAESTVWGDSADPDCDGVVNFLEFAWGLNPNSPDSSPATGLAPGLPEVFTIEEGDQSYLAIGYSQTIESPCHEQVVGISDDLVAWDYTETDIVQVGSSTTHSNGITEYVVKRSTIAIADGERRFLSTRVTGNHP